MKVVWLTHRTPPLVVGILMLNLSSLGCRGVKNSDRSEGSSESGSETMVNQSPDTRAGDSGEGLPGFITDPNQIKFSLAGAGHAVIDAPEKSITFVPGDADSHLISAFEVTREVFEQVQADSGSIAVFTGTLVGSTTARENGSFTLTINFAQADGIVFLRAGGKVSDSRIAISGSTAGTRHRIIFADPAEDKFFRPLLTAKDVGSTPNAMASQAGDGVPAKTSDNLSLMMHDTFDRPDTEQVNSGRTGTLWKSTVGVVKVVSNAGCNGGTGVPSQLRTVSGVVSDVDFKFKLSDRGPGASRFRFRGNQQRGYRIGFEQNTAGKFYVSISSRSISKGNYDSLRFLEVGSLDGLWEFKMIGSEMTILRDGSVFTTLSNTDTVGEASNVYLDFEGSVCLDQVTVWGR